MLKNFLLTAGLFLSVSAVNAATLIRYEFNGDLTDSSGNSADATVVAGSVSYVAGVDGQAASFDGSTAVAMPNNSIRGNPDFTLSFRFKTTSTDMVILGYQNTQYPNLPGNYIPIVGVTPAGELRVPCGMDQVLFLSLLLQRLTTMHGTALMLSPTPQMAPWKLF